MNALEKFQKGVETFLELSGMPPTTFGKKAVGDAMFVSRLRNGRIPNIVTAERVVVFIETYKKPKEN